MGETVAVIAPTEATVVAVRIGGGCVTMSNGLTAGKMTPGPDPGNGVGLWGGKRPGPAGDAEFPKAVPPLLLFISPTLPPTLPDPLIEPPPRPLPSLTKEPELAGID
jgi:hypothetical protein